MKPILLFFLLCLFFFNEAGFPQLTIKPTRSISFTTTEGSQMNVAVSPDGKTLLFDMLGEIFSLPSIGGTASQLTSGLEVNLRPCWLPDGKSFACYNDANGKFDIKIRGLNGSESTRKLDLYYPTDDIIWKPDGKGFKMFDNLYSLTGDAPATLDNGYWAFAFDGNERFYFPLEEPGKSFTIIYKRHIYDTAKIKIGTLDVTKIELSSCRMSPDQNLVSFISLLDGLYKLHVKNLVTGEQKLLMTLSTSKLGYGFSPDSKFIYLSNYGKIYRINVSTAEKEIVPFTANINIRLGKLNTNTSRLPQGTFVPSYIRSTHLSADGRKMCFMTQGQIYIANFDGSNPRPIVNMDANQFQPAFSPNGKKIAFVTWADTEGGALWYVDLTTKKTVKVSQDAGIYQCPAWSPDGNALIVLRGTPKLGDRDDSGFGELTYFDLQNKTSRKLVDSLPLRNLIRFSKDGKRIIYRQYNDYSQQGPSAFLASCDLNGQNKKEIARSGGLLVELQAALSPDQRFIVCAIDEDIYLFPIKAMKGIPFIFSVSGFDDATLAGIRLAKGVDPVWSNNGKIFGWTYANKFFQANPDSVIAESERKGYLENDTFEMRRDFADLFYKAPDIRTIQLKESVRYGKGMIAFTNVRIITMNGNQVIEDGVVLIKNGRVADVGPADSIQVPAGYVVMNLQGKTIIPGLVDLHLHMRLYPDIFPQQSWMFLINLAYGVTTGRDPSLSFDSFGYKEMLETGKMIGPRLITVGRSIRPYDGVIRMANMTDARAVIEKRKQMRGSEVKQYDVGHRAQRQYVLRACIEKGLNMTNEGGGDYIFMLQMIKDGCTGIEHNLNWTGIREGEDNIIRDTHVQYRTPIPTYNDMIQFISRSGTYITPTLQVGYAPAAKEYFKYKYWSEPNPKLARFNYDDGMFQLKSNGAESLTTIRNKEISDTLPLFIEAAKIDAAIYNAGGKITLGSHGNNEGIGEHNEIWALQMGGLTNHQALEIATIRGAEALGLQEDIGSIAKGKIADLVILNSNPLEDIHNTRDIKYVMKEGILYDGDTLDTVWPYHKACPEWRYKLGSK